MLLLSMRLYTPRSKWNKNTNLTTDDHIFWTTWFTWWEGVFFKYGSKTVLIHYCLPQIAAEMKYFVTLQSFTKNKWSQFTLQEMISRKFRKEIKAHNFTKKQKNSAKTMMLIFAFCFIFTKQGGKLKQRVKFGF